MEQHPFSGHVQVEIQGSKVLRVLQRTNQYVDYEVVGFEGKVVLRDTRAQGLQAIEYLESTGDARYFPDAFSSPAYAQIATDENGILRIQLEDSQNPPKLLAHVLWIAIGISDEIPFYDYQHQWIEFLDANKIGMIAVFAKNSNSVGERIFIPPRDETKTQGQAYSESAGW